MTSLQLQQAQNMQACRPLVKLFKASRSAWRNGASLRALQPHAAATDLCLTPFARSVTSTYRGLSPQGVQGFRTLAATAGSENTDPEIENAIREAERASEAAESSAPRMMNPEPSLPGSVLPETTLLEGEDHTSAFAGRAEEARAEQAATEHLDAVRQGANVGAIAEEQPGVSEPMDGSAATPDSASALSSESVVSETESDAEELLGDPRLDAASAMFLEEADLPLKGAPPMDKLSDPSIIETWLSQRRCASLLPMHQSCRIAHA